MNPLFNSDSPTMCREMNSQLVVRNGHLNIPVPERFERIAGEFLSGTPRPLCVEEACYAQLLEFYFCGTGRLSRFINYSELFDGFAFPVRPKEVSVVLTKLCNMTCLHCYNNSGRKDPNELSAQEKLQLIDYLCRWGIGRLTITGGEPTLDPLLPKCLHLATSFGVGVKLSTNAWRLPDAVVNAIGEKTVQQLNISLDGADAETHDTFRRKRGSFDEVIRTLSALRTQPPRLLVINASVHRLSIDQMPAVAKIAADFDATAVSFKPITSTGRSDLDTSFFLDENLLKRFRDERNRLRQKYKGILEIDGKLIEADFGDLLENVTCNAGRTAMMIDADGRMLPCETVSFVSDAPNCRDVLPMQAWLSSPLFNWFRTRSASSPGGCGTKGCPGSQIRAELGRRAESLVQIS
jgi:MoaA/NifB/PqqE/SkfB family radical SAM enzyme